MDYNHQCPTDWNNDVVRKFLLETYKLELTNDATALALEGKNLLRMTSSELETNLQATSLPLNKKELLQTILNHVWQLTDQYILGAKKPSPKQADFKIQKVFNDPNWGQMELHPILVAMINTPEFDRLRNITQMGGCYYVYPGCSHNRFEHSIGVAYLAGKLVENLQRKQPELEITYVDALCVKIAGLCHDLGHGPFSHLFDGHFLKKLEKKGLSPENVTKHEDLSLKLFDRMTKQEAVKAQCGYYGIREDEIEIIKDLITGKEEDFFTITHGNDTVSAVPKVDWSAKDYSKRQLWYKRRQPSPDESFALYNHEYKCYLKHDGSSFALNDHGSNLDASCLWKANNGDLTLQKSVLDHDAYYIVKNELCLTVVPEVQRNSQDPSKKCWQLWYREKSYKGESCFVLHNRECTSYLGVNEENQLTLTTTVDDKKISCLWKTTPNQLKLKNKQIVLTLKKSELSNPKSKLPVEKHFLFEIVANKYNEIDVDKWDYFTRDCHSLGLKHGFDQMRLLNSARVMKRENEDLHLNDDNYHIAYRDVAMQDLIGMFYTRAQLHKRACQHKASYAVEMMISDALIQAEEDGFEYSYWSSSFKPLEKNPTIKLSNSFTDLEGYMALTDNILEIIRLWSKENGKQKCTEILEKLTARDLYKCCFDVSDSPECWKLIESVLRENSEMGNDIVCEEVKIQRKLNMCNVLIYEKGAEKCTSLAKAYPKEEDSIMKSIHEEKRIRVYCTDPNKADEYTRIFKKLKRKLDAAEDGTHNA